VSTQFIEQLLNGIVNGCIYALVAVGLTLIYGILGVINVAHGELFMLGAFVAYFIYVTTGSYVLAVLAAIVATAVVGLLMERLVFRPLQVQPRIVSLIASVGLSLVLANSALVLWGGEPRFFKTPLATELLQVGPISFSAQRGLVIVSAVLIIIAMTFFLQRTRLGKALRASAQDLEACSLAGIEIKWIVAFAFALGAALAGAAGALLSPLSVMTPDMGLLAVLKAFAVVVVGGFGNIPGTIIAGLLMGVAESLGGAFISATYQDSIVFIILTLALLIRPTGLVREQLEENI
jgi:branched-chain amino acid transport system permease protein